MKILIMEPLVVLDRSFAGSTHAKELSTNLSDLGNQVTLIARSYKTEIANLNGVVFKNVTLIRTPRNARKRTSMGIRTIIELLLAFVLGFKILLKSEADLIYERYPIPIGLIIGKIFRVPVIVEVNGFLIDELDLGQTLKGIFLALERWIFHSADRIVAVTPKLKETICKFHDVPQEKVSVVTNGVNVELFKPMDIKVARENLGFDITRKIVGFVGKLDPWQGVEYLVRAAPFVLKEVHEAMFLIVGDGVMYPELVSMVNQFGLEKDFVFTGEIPYEEVPQYVNVNNVCVTLKRKLRSGFAPLKLYEYMACGKPVIATNTDGFEVLKKHKAGVLVNPDDLKEVSNSIIELLLSAELQQCLGKNGREAVLNEFSWKAVAKRTVTIFEEELENRLKH